MLGPRRPQRVRRDRAARGRRWPRSRPDERTAGLAEDTPPSGCCWRWPCSWACRPGRRSSAARASRPTAAAWRSAAPPTATTTGPASQRPRRSNSWSTPAPPAPRSPPAWRASWGCRLDGRVQSQTAGGVVQGRVVRADLQLQRRRARRAPAHGRAAGAGSAAAGHGRAGPLRWQQDDGVLRIDLHASGSVTQAWHGSLRAALAAAGWRWRAGRSAVAAPTCPPPPVSPTRRNAAPQRDARDRGLLWRISRDGRELPLRHAARGQPAWSPPGPAARGAGAQRRAGPGIDLIDPAAAALQQATPGAGLPAPPAERCRRKPTPPAWRRGAAGPAPGAAAITLTMLEARWTGWTPPLRWSSCWPPGAHGGRRGVAGDRGAADAALVPHRRREAQALMDQRWSSWKSGRASRCCAAWPRPGKRATWTRWSATRTGANAPTATSARLAAPAERRAQPAAGRWHRRPAPQRPARLRRGGRACT